MSFLTRAERGVWYPALNTRKLGHMQKRAPLPPAWEVAILNWTNSLREEGKSVKTITLREKHVRSIAALSRTARPDQLTPEAIVSICTRQEWINEYRRDVRTSLASFYDRVEGMNPARANIQWCEWPELMPQ